MTPILDRIRSKGGQVTRKEWNIVIRRGRLDDAAMEWIKSNRQALMLEVWPEYDAFEERAAIREYDGGQDRASAERDAYAEVMGC